MNILILEPKDYSKKALAMYSSLGRVYLWPDLNTKQKKTIKQKADVLVLRLAYKIDAGWFGTMPDLKVVATPTTGLNHIDLEEARKRGIKIISLKGHTHFLKDIPSTAEETFGLILALVRNLPWAFDDVKKGNWNRNAWKGWQLKGKTLGLLGCGRLGKIVARYARAFGMSVIGADPHVDARTMKRYGIAKVGMADLFRTSDIVSVHVSLESKTHNLVNEEHLKIMKPTAYLVNTARGEIIDEAALARALQKKWIAGAAADVLWDESSDGAHLKKSPLAAYARKHTNCIIVPHIGGATYDAMKITEEFIAGLVKKNFRK